MKNPWVLTIIIAVTVGAAAFYGGMQYQQSQRGALVQRLNGPNGNNDGRRFGPNGNNNNRAVRGEILSLSNNNLTIKMPDGSSRIVILSGNTVITQSTSAAKSDLQNGKQIAVFGTVNSDGTITAQDIQLNPQGFLGRPGTSGQPTLTPAPTQ